MTKEDYSKLVSSVKEKLDETTQAIVSDDFLNLISSYNLLADELAEKNETIQKLTSDNEELLKVNGKLFQKIGFEKPETNEENDGKKEDEIKIEDIIDEKGELIK